MNLAFCEGVAGVTGRRSNQLSYFPIRALGEIRTPMDPVNLSTRS